jgi:hypothetical protein
MLLRLLQVLLAALVRWLTAPRGPAQAPPGSRPPGPLLPPPIVPPDAVEVAYAPRRDGAPDPGEVVWTWVPYEDDPAQGKDRPVLVVGRRGAQLACVPLTSKRHERAAQVELGVGPWDREGRVSYAKIDRLLDVAPAAVRREGAALDRPRFDRVIAALREAHGARIAG